MATPIVVPKLNENDDEVIVVELSQGYVASGQALFAVETSKAVEEVEAETSGFVLWGVRVADRVGVLSEIGRLFATEDERDAWASTPKPAHVVDSRPSESRPATDPARRLAGQLGVSVDDVPGTGIVRERDVRALFELTSRTTPQEPMAAQPTRGRLSDALRAQLRRDPASMKNLSSDAKVALYREHGALIGARVSIGHDTVIDAEYIELGDDTSIGDGVTVKARRFTIGQLGQIGAGCRFFCRDFIAGDVVTFRWSVAVVDGQGGIHDCRVGDLSFIAYDTYLNTDRDVHLGERVCLSPGARIYTHRKWLEALDGFPFAYAPVSIGPRCWLGPGSLILPGVVLGEGVTVMANSVVAANVPRGALVGGIPAAVIKKQQREELDTMRRGTLLAGILDGNGEALAAMGWRVARADDAGIWSGKLVGPDSSCRLLAVNDGLSAGVAASERVIVVAFTNAGLLDASADLTVFDLEGKVVRGRRDAASDVVRHLLFKYGTVFEPRVWRFGARVDETTY